MTNPSQLFVDGSNVLLNLRPNGQPSVAVFLAVLEGLRSRGFTVVAIFDQSIRYLLEQAGVPAEWPVLERAAAESKGTITFDVEADPHLLAAAIESSGAVVNHSDRYKKWLTIFGRLPPLVRVGLVGDRLTFNFEDGSEPPFAIKLEKSKDGGTPATKTANVEKSRDVASSLQGETKVTEKLLKSTRRQDQTLKARIIVFALDASGSMFNPEEDGYNTHDGASKGEHVVRELRAAVDRMCACNVSHSFFCSVVAFAGSADVKQIKGHKMAHVTYLRDALADKKYQYDDVITDSRGTNIGNALTTCRELIDSVLTETSNKTIATSWSATIILLTDGRAGDSDSVKHAAAHLEGGVFAGPVKKIDLACVGIGKDVDFDLLKSIASSPGEEAIKMLKNNQLHEKLPQDGFGGRLMALRIDMTNPQYAEVIRAFIDIASTTVLAP